ncbi:hypothetical protein EWM64_g5096 [Hericium alpestre]|uniref:Reverse transcriptase RNase H-like domain-containing protein n=1 Tax=Hericium alpestre TaxID=135208 RepID=A0A4Y9ZWG2_9AGAM|nr:hypothetical protein EWM64_g5096 [Hericium alpestre]
MEGRGYFWYICMPFRFTGAPSSFAHVTASHLHDLIAEDIMELLVDNGGAFADEFSKMMVKLQHILTCVRDCNLSLSAVHLPMPCSKPIYCRAMQGFKLGDYWTVEHSKAFLRYKAAVTSELVLCRPHWDGTPFIVTTNGCKDGFVGVLTQQSSTLLPNGRTVIKLHPLAFALKHTSPAEEKYMPFLLEFAALKFALDKFAHLIGHFSVEIETDCQALRDVLLSDKLNTVHARWHDGILTYQIVNVRHVPGKLNVVADALSRKGKGTPKVIDDGSEWTASEDWDTSVGLADDLLLTLDDPQVSVLHDHFYDELLF